MSYNRRHITVPDSRGLHKNWPQRQSIASNPASPLLKWGMIGGAALITIGVVLLLRKPAIAGAKMAMDKLKINELLAKWKSTPVTKIPVTEAPPSLVKIYPLANATTKALLDTTPFGDLAGWTSNGYYTFPADTASVNQVHAIASGPQEFVQKTKDAAIAVATKYGIKDPRFLVAQAGHEGNWGKNSIGNANIFGHVASEKWTSDLSHKYSYETTHEWIGSGDTKKKIATVRPFRLYDSLQDAFDAHVQVLKGHSSWGGVFTATTIQDYATALTNAPAYATDPQYVQYLTSAFNTVAQYW